MLETFKKHRKNSAVPTPAHSWPGPTPKANPHTRGRSLHSCMATAHTQSQSPCTWPLPMHVPLYIHMPLIVHVPLPVRTPVHLHVPMPALMRVPAPATMRVGRAPTLKKAAAAVDCRRYDRVVPKPINGSFTRTGPLLRGTRRLCLQPVRCVCPYTAVVGGPLL